MSAPPYRILFPEGEDVFLLEDVQLRAEPGYPQEIESCDLQLLVCQILLHHMTSLCPREGRTGGSQAGISLPVLSDPASQRDHPYNTEGPPKQITW